MMIMHDPVDGRVPGQHKNAITAYEYHSVGNFKNRVSLPSIAFVLLLALRIDLLSVFICP